MMKGQIRFCELQAAGYVARSAYKLLEIQEKHRIIPRGGLVLDLGCHPGAWLQVACQAIGPRSAGGAVLGIDIQVGSLQHQALELGHLAFMWTCCKSLDVVCSRARAHIPRSTYIQETSKPGKWCDERVVTVQGDARDLSLDFWQEYAPSVSGLHCTAARNTAQPWQGRQLHP